MKTFMILVTMFALFATVFTAPTGFVPHDNELTESNHLERRGGSGRGTWYSVGLGSCGWTNKNSELVCALSGQIMKGYKSSYCGKKISITSGGKKYSCKVVDTCPSCAKGDVDMSTAMFKKFAPLSKGVLSIKWS